MENKSIRNDGALWPNENSVQLHKANKSTLVGDARLMKKHDFSKMLRESDT